MKLSKCHFFMKEIQYLGHILKHQGHPTITFEDACHPEHASTQNTQTGSCLPWISRLGQKIHSKVCKNS